MKNFRLFLALLILLFGLSFAGMAAISLGIWLPASKWWILLSGYLGLTALLLLLRHQNKRAAIVIFVSVLFIFSSVIALHRPFQFTKLNSNTLQSFAQQYPSPQNDTYMMYSYLFQHFHEAEIHVSSDLTAEITEEALYALGGASSVQFIDPPNLTGCQFDQQNLEVIHGFFGTDYAFSKAIRTEKPILIILQEDNIVYTLSDECSLQFQKVKEP